MNVHEKYLLDLVIVDINNGLDIRLIELYLISPFNRRQIDILREGAYKGLTVAKLKFLAKPYFDYKQMNEILLGLLDNIDIRKYSKKNIDWKCMREIRLSLLKKKINVVC